MPELTVPQVLRDAAQLLRERGWLQGAYTWYSDKDKWTPIPNAPLCAGGAIHVAVGGSPSFWHLSEEGKELARAARRVVGIRLPGTDLLSYNDREGRTATEVIDLLERVAQEVEDEVA